MEKKIDEILNNFHLGKIDLIEVRKQLLILYGVSFSFLVDFNNENMNWINVNERMPECWSQHGKSFATGYLLTYDKYGEYQINQYWEHGEHTSKGWVKSSEGWEEMDGEITHWCELTPPKN